MWRCGHLHARSWATNRQVAEHRRAPGVPAAAPRLGKARLRAGAAGQAVCVAVLRRQRGEAVAVRSGSDPLPTVSAVPDEPEFYAKFVEARHEAADAPGRLSDQLTGCKQVMEAAIVRLVEAKEAGKNTELAVNPSCERLYDLLRQAEEDGDAWGAAFAEHLLALLRNRFLVSTSQLPADLRAGVLQYAGLLLALDWPLEGLPEEVRPRLREAAMRAMGVAGTAGPSPADSSTPAPAPDTPPAASGASASADQAAASPAAPPWVPPAVSSDDISPVTAAAVLAERLGAASDDLAGAGEEAGMLRQLAVVLQLSARAVMGTHAADPKAAQSMSFMLEFAADTLQRRGDRQGASLMACCAALLAGVRAPQAAALPPDLAVALATVEARARARGWTTVAPERRGEGGSPPGVDSDAALKDALGYSLLCFAALLQRTPTPG